MKKAKKYFSISLLLFLSFTTSAQKPALDLTQPDQQKDFLQYLKTTISLLEDTSLKEMMKGYKLESLSDSDKQQIAFKMMKDTAYFKRLYDYFAFMRTLDNKYGISKFSNEELGEVAQFGATHGIYFIQAMKKLKEQKYIYALPNIPYIFPAIPLKNPTDTSHSLRSP